MADTRDTSEVGVQYDRALLLGPRRNDVLTLAEVQKYGRDSYGDPDYLRLYGMKPADWYRSGVRLLGRTAVECTRDVLADHVGRDVAAVASEPSLVIDPFTGSGNTLYWLQQHLGVPGVGFELDEAIFATTAANLRIVSSTLRVSLGAYEDRIQAVEVDRDGLVVVFVAPPWGDALDPVEGLDLARTTPPVAEIHRRIAAAFPGNPLLFATQVYETIEPRSFDRLTVEYDWWTLVTYDFNAPGQNHGLVIGSQRWRPTG